LQIYVIKTQGNGIFLVVEIAKTITLLRVWAHQETPATCLRRTYLDTLDDRKTDIYIER